MTDSRVIKTYVFHDHQCFFVSTIERDSSAIDGGRYNETLVWEHDWEKRERGKMIGQYEGFKGSIKTHQRVVQTLFEDGNLKAMEEQ